MYLSGVYFYLFQSTRCNQTPYFDLITYAHYHRCVGWICDNPGVFKVGGYPLHLGEHNLRWN